MSMPRDLQTLLRWGVEHTQPGETAPSTRPAPKALDPAIVDAILGKTDAVRMRECVAAVGDAARPLDNRMAAWDELEMILESLDNANDLASLGLWPPLVKHLTSTEDETVVQALWVCGTAINNNPQAREAFLKQDPLATLASLPRTSTPNADVRAKALYCLGGALKHDPDALQRFIDLDGFSALEDALRDPSLPCRRKATFLLGTLLLDDLTSALARRALVPPSALVTLLVDALSPSTAQPTGVDGDGDGFDVDVAESAVRALRALGPEALSPTQRAAIGEAIEANDGFGLAESERAEFLTALGAA